MSNSRLSRFFLASLHGAFCGLLLVAMTVGAQAQAAAPAVALPNLWDAGRRAERPDMTRIASIRFLTEEDYPPFNFKAADGSLAGFNVELARAICDELKLTCTIQMRRWDRLQDALDQNQGDAVIASFTLSAETRRRFETSDRYMLLPARFVARRNAAPTDALPETLRGKRIGVIANSAHAAYLAAFFKGSDVRPYANDTELRAALKGGQVELVFGDGVGLGFWVHGTSSENCCGFVGGPFLESRYFGEGMTILMRRGNQPLRAAINYALQRLWERGVYTDLYLRYFPASIF